MAVRLFLRAPTNFHYIPPSRYVCRSGLRVQAEAVSLRGYVKEIKTKEPVEGKRTEFMTVGGEK